MNIGLPILRSIGSFVLQVIFALVFANFVLFTALFFYLGGDALSGKEEHGHFFLGSHGHYTEVTPQVFRYSEVHARSVEYTMPVIMLVGLLLLRGPGHTSRSTFSHGKNHQAGDA
jgi:hypothetical protein